MRTLSFVIVAALVSSVSAQADEPAASDRPVVARLAPTEQLQLGDLPKAPPTPVYKRWYFWTAVGAVVTAAAVGVALAATQSHPPLNESQVCGARGCDACVGFACSTP